MSLAELQRDPTAAWAISRTIALEGGLVNNPADPGGITNYGVSLRFALQEVQAHPDLIPIFDLDHDGHVGPADIRGMTRDEAVEVYYDCIWKPGPFDDIKSVLIAWKLFDVTVNTGPKRAATILQTALNQRGRRVEIDGDLGPETMAAMNSECTLDGGAGLLFAMRQAQSAFYQRLAHREPKLGVFLNGWMARASA